ncbi:hypothetical protein V3C99_012484, partial [Haemonchus contortus]
MMASVDGNSSDVAVVDILTIIEEDARLETWIDAQMFFLSSSGTAIPGLIELACLTVPRLRIEKLITSDSLRNRKHWHNKQPWTLNMGQILLTSRGNGGELLQGQMAKREFRLFTESDHLAEERITDISRLKKNN